MKEQRAREWHDKHITLYGGGKSGYWLFDEKRRINIVEMLDEFAASEVAEATKERATEQDVGRELKASFIHEFCNDHNGTVRWLRSVALDEAELLAMILAWFDAALCGTGKQTVGLIAVNAYERQRVVIAELVERLREADYALVEHHNANWPERMKQNGYSCPVCAAPISTGNIFQRNCAALAHAQELLTPGKQEVGK